MAAPMSSLTAQFRRKSLKVFRHVRSTPLRVKEFLDWDNARNSISQRKGKAIGTLRRAFVRRD